MTATPATEGMAEEAEGMPSGPAWGGGRRTETAPPGISYDYQTL